MLQLAPPEPSGVLWRLWEAGSAGAGSSSRVGSPPPLTSHLPLVSGVPDPGQHTPLCSVPAPLQDPPRNPSAELMGPSCCPTGVSQNSGWGLQRELQGQAAAVSFY